MKKSILQTPNEEFDDRNNFLYFIMGLVSFSQNILSSFGLDGKHQPADKSSDEPEDSGSSNSASLPRKILR